MDCYFVFSKGVNKLVLNFKIMVFIIFISISLLEGAFRYRDYVYIE